MLSSRHLANRLFNPSNSRQLRAIAGTVLVTPQHQSNQKRTWMARPDIKGAKDGTSSGILFPFLVAVGLVGAGVLVWKLEKKRQFNKMIEMGAETVLKCEDCQHEIPSRSKIVREGVEQWAYCPYCKKMNFVFEQRRVPLCKECGLGITVGRYSTNLQNDVYCSTHSKKPHKSCFFCSRFIYLDRPERDKDKHRFKIHSCSDCRKTKMPRSDIQKAAAHVVQELKDGYGIDLGPNVSYSIKMVRRMPSDIKFAPAVPGEHRSLVGQTSIKVTSILNPFKKSNNWNGNIVILDGFDQVGFEKVLAHELGHVYIRAHKIHFPPDIEEGLCNLVSYLYLRQLCKKTEPPAPQLRFHMRTMEKDVDEIYGDGFRKVFNIYFNIRNKTNTEIPFNEFLEVLRSNYGTRMNTFSYPTRRAPFAEK